MKKTILFFLLAIAAPFLQAQHCIDLLVLNFPTENTQRADSVFCKILSENEEVIVIDNGYTISSIAKSLVKELQTCAREMNARELYIFKGIDYVTKDYFQNKSSAGNYLRKAANNAYLATGLGLIGSAGIVLGTSVFKNSSYDDAWIIGGSITCAASLFFLTLAWNNVHQAGKLLDINEHSALYLTPGNHGGLGLAIRFR